METSTTSKNKLAQIQEQEKHDLYLTTRTSIEPDFDGEMDAKIVRIKTKISIPSFDLDIEDEDDFPVVGQIKAQKISDLNAHSFDTICDACDSISQELYEAFSSCFKEVDGDIQSKAKLFDLPDSFIYIEEMVIDKEYRGSGLGSAAVKRFIDDMANGNLIIVKPFAIEDRANEKTHKRVHKFWSSLGFKKVGNSGYYLIEYFDFANQF